MPVKSKSQARKFYELFDQGKISHKMLSEWTSGVNVKKLPERIGKKKKTK